MPCKNQSGTCSTVAELGVTLPMSNVGSCCVAERCVQPTDARVAAVTRLVLKPTKSLCLPTRRHSGRQPRTNAVVMTMSVIHRGPSARSVVMTMALEVAAASNGLA